MKKKLFLSLLIVLTLVLGFSLRNNETFSNLVESKLFFAGEESVELTVGTYTSSDGHTITVGEDSVVKYDDTYTLTATASDRGYVISGKIGTNNMAVTFYQLNDSKLVSGEVVSYTHSGSTVYLYDYTVFSMDATPVVDENGVIEVYHDNNLVNKYSDLQSAVDSASNGDTIKITSDMDVVGGAYINKDLTIEGNNKTLNVATWANSLFVVEEGAKLTLKNFIIDGGADEFKIDFSLDYPKLVDGTLNSNVRANTSSIVSKGELNTNNLTIRNYYAGGLKSAVRVLRGNANIVNSKFVHNYGKEIGVALHIGSSLRSGETSYPVKHVVIDNSLFEDNFTVGGSGGAVMIVMTEKIEINNTNFKRNMASTTSSGGGAVYFDSSAVGVAEKNDLEYTQAYFNNSTFEENYSGNDGYAISSDSAELFIDNCKFIGNVGLDSSTSVGTISTMIVGTRKFDVVIKNSVFEKNNGPVNVFGDHGTLAELEMSNVEVKNNVGNIDVLLYSGNAKITDVTFTNEKVNAACIDIRPYRSESNYPLYKPQTITLNNVQFNNTDGPTDVLVRKFNYNSSFNDATLVVEDNVVGNIHLWNGTNVVVKGDLTGDIVTDSITTSENVKIEEDAKFIGNTIFNENTYIVEFYYPSASGTSVKFLYLEKDKVYTEKELYMVHFIGKEDAKLEYYTGANFTTPWDYAVTANTTVYAKWVEHEHVYDQDLIVYNNAIYEQCECGYLGNKLSLSIPTDLYYSGNKIEAVVDNELSLEGYTVKYQVMDKDGNFVDMEGVPVKVGTYKAILIYDDMTITSEYSIIEKPVNPSTGIFTPYIVSGLIIGFGIVGIKLFRKKKYM